MMCQRPIPFSDGLCEGCIAETDEELDRLMSMPDEEVMAECWAMGVDPNVEGEHVREFLIKCVEKIQMDEKNKEPLQ
jgi:hypothetical protein